MNEAALHHFMSNLVRKKDQVWVAQRLISNECRPTLIKLPGVLRQPFRLEAEKVLEQWKESSEARLQRSGIVIVVALGRHSPGNAGRML